MKKPTVTRERQRITHDTIVVNDREFTVTFKTDGLHIREKFQREERIVPLDQIVSMRPSPTAACRDFKDGSASEALDLAACDLRELARLLHDSETSLSAILEVKKSTNNAVKIIRALEAVAR